MTIREATHNDIPQILKVLKASLGETSSKKTEKVWRFKHVDNPFGESMVLVAEEGREIIGVRAFMRWKWQKGEQVFSAFRAVDTATHPEHQGKGIFKKLTLRALDLGKERGDHFVFNTPNTQSKPGYLKMGWREVGKVRTHLVPVNPFYRKKKILESGYTKSLENFQLDDVLQKSNFNLIKSEKLFTPKSIDYLSWRYLNNPLQKYFVETTDDFFVAGYVKKHSLLQELRISEIIVSPNFPLDSIRKIIRKWAKGAGVNLISLSDPLSRKFFNVTIPGNFGPTLTFRAINNDLPKNYFLNHDSWAYSLGDLELF